MRIAVLGAGGGGASAVVELTGNGCSVNLWNRSTGTLQPFVAAGGVKHTGILGTGKAKPALISDDLENALQNVAAVLVCLPTHAHESLAEALVEIGANELPVVLNPGHTGGALSFRRVFERAGLAPPPVAEFSTLTYVARKSGPDTVHTTGVANRVWVACLPGDESAVEIAQKLYPAAVRAPNLLATSLANVNMVLHPPGAILGASWVESTGGDFTFYVQGLSAGVGRIMERLDAERLAVAAGFGLHLDSLFSEMQAIGTIERTAVQEEGIASAVRGGTANSRLMAPNSLAHRYYIEDFFFGVRPFLEMASIAGVQAPVAAALMTLAEHLADPDGRIEGRTAAAMGIDGFGRAELLNLVTG